MTRSFACSALIAVATACGGSEDAEPKKPDPVLEVRSAVARVGAINDEISAYGTIVPAPGAAVTVSRPFETKVAQVMVTAGQRVSAGDALIRLEPSPDTRLRFDEAGRAEESAKRGLEAVKRRFDLGLATSADMVAAQQAHDQAAAENRSLRSRGASSGDTIIAPRSGLVTRVHVQQGALVSAGQPLLELSAEASVEAQIGIELGRAAYVHEGDKVRITAVSRGAVTTADGKVRGIAQAVDPGTRLITVMVTIPTHEFLLGEFVQASLAGVTHQGLLVPRSAVLPESDAFVLFTIEGNKAKRHVVKVGFESATDVEVLGSDIKAGARVIVLGNYGCSDGELVRDVSR